MRIAILADPNSPNALYRSVLPMSALHTHGHELRTISPGGSTSRAAEVRGIDVLHVHRYWEDNTQRLMLEAIRHGAAVVYDDDDDIGANPKGTIAHRRQGGLYRERRLAALRRIFRIVNLVTSPSTELTQRFQALGAAHTATIENYIPGLFLRHADQPHNGIVIGWVAGGEHSYDAQQLAIKPLLQRILDERPDVSVVTVGIGLGLDSDRYHHNKYFPLVSFERRTVTSGPRAAQVTLRKQAAGGLANITAAFDIGIAPLADVPFNHARSNIKLKEYAAGGTAWLASPVGPYRNMGEAQGGRLVADDDWYAAILRLVDRARERRKLAKRAANWAAEQTIEKNCHRWETEFAEAAERARTPMTRTAL